uniref:Huntingtin-interacting protein 1-related protein-like n=1 Tax=Sinocyclocheilus anshuiensis TaxID=1608454 RepID=A0A671NGA5_9TELE
MMLCQISISSALQLQSITKSMTNVEAPIKEKYGRNIILGTHKEGGAVTFWSHAVSLPLSSNAILSWKFCHVVHKLLRDGHPNTLRDSRGHTANIRQMGTLWGNLHDRYGHIVALYAKLLCVKIDFHLKHLEIPPNLEAPEQVLDKAIAIDINKVFDMTGEVLEYMEAALKLQETVFRQMESSSTSSTTPVGQCRLAPLVLIIQDCSPLYHFLVKLLFKLHSRESCCLHAEPPNFLRAASFADHVKPVVVQNETFPDYDDTDTQLDFETEADTLRKELEVVKPELELIKVEAQRAVVQLKSQVNILESELEDQRTHKQMALVENERLRMEVESLRAAQLHQTTLQQERDRHQREMTALQNQLQEKVSFCCHNFKQNSMRRELEEKRAELLRAQSALNSKETVSTSSSVDPLLQTYASCLHLCNNDFLFTQAFLLLCVFSVQLSQDLGLLQQKLQDEQFSMLQCAVVEAEGIVLDAVAKVDDPLHVRCISTPDYLINRAELTLASIDKMHVMQSLPPPLLDASGLLRSVTQFSHLIADTIVNGAGTAHSAPTDQADRLTDNCRDCATHCLQLNLCLRDIISDLSPGLLQDLRPRGADVQKEELAEMVDKEMAATSSAIEDAVLRMDEILSQARRDSSGVKLEVNQKLVWDIAIHMLVMAATDLQRDIVESGRGAGSVKDFYAKNSRWTEGLISASKAVGWGATQMLESADKVVTDKGKYEELIVCSHEIAASTAQLVAASKVKADRGNKKLQTLQQASRYVNDMAAVVVSSTKSGQMQIENKNSMDFSGMSVIKLKTEEMDSQVKVLELEKQLVNERIRLGELRRKHYEMGGIPMDSPPGNTVNSFDSSLPTVFPDPPNMELPSLDHHQLMAGS